MNAIALLILLAAADPQGEGAGAAESKAKNKAAAAGMVTPDAAKPEKAEKPPLDVEKMPFTRDSIKQIVEYNLDKIQSCYEETLADKDNPVQGKLMTSFIITPEGLVKKARVEKQGTTLKEPKLHSCVVAVLSTLTFPKPPDKKEHPLEYPFNLKAVR